MRTSQQRKNLAQDYITYHFSMCNTVSDISDTRREISR